MSEGLRNWASISGFAGPSESPGFVLWRDFMRWQRELNSRLRPLGLTQPQFAILAVCGWLTRDDREVTQQDIAAFLEFDRMHVSQIVTRLEKTGLILRRVAEGDLRAKQVTLSARGQDVLRRAMPIVEEFDRTFFATREV